MMTSSDLDQLLHEELMTAFQEAPLSEKTLIKKGFKFGKHGEWKALNDIGHLCEYRIQNLAELTLGVIKYYRGSKLSVYGLENE